jgi:hypothetical protein
VEKLPGSRGKSNFSVCLTTGADRSLTRAVST